MKGPEEAEAFLKKRIEQNEWSVLEHAGVDIEQKHVDLSHDIEPTPAFGLAYARATLGGLRYSDIGQYSTEYAGVKVLTRELPRDTSLLTFHISCSIATARQLERHRNFSFCERSLRYVKVAPETFAACLEDVADLEHVAPVVDLALKKYAEMLDAGLSPDRARYVLPLCTQTEICVTGQVTWWVDLLSKRYHTKASDAFILLCQQIKEHLPEEAKSFFLATYGEQIKKADDYVAEKQSRL